MLVVCVDPDRRYPDQATPTLRMGHIYDADAVDAALIEIDHTLWDADRFKPLRRATPEFTRELYRHAHH